MGILDRIRSVGSRVKSGVESKVESRRKERERTSTIRSLARRQEDDETIRYKEKLKGQRQRRQMKERQAPPRRTKTRTSRRSSRRPKPRHEPRGMLGLLGQPPSFTPPRQSKDGRSFNLATMEWTDRKKRKR